MSTGEELAPSLPFDECGISFAGYNVATAMCCLHCTCGDDFEGDTWQEVGALMDEHLSDE